MSEKRNQWKESLQQPYYNNKQVGELLEDASDRDSIKNAQKSTNYLEEAIRKAKKFNKEFRKEEGGRTFD